MKKVVRHLPGSPVIKVRPAMNRLFVVVAVASIGVGVTIGFVARGARSTPAEAADRSAWAVARQAELAKLAVVAQAARSSTGQPPSTVEGELPAPPPPPSSDSLEAPATARSERDAHLARLQESGTSPAEFVAAMPALENEWAALARAAHIDVGTTPWRCYRAGCYSTFTFKDANAVEDLGARLADSKGLRAWPGGKFRSGPISTPTGTEITWVFFAPES